MKIKSLIIGSIAAAGLTSGAYAADLGTVLTSLNVCDALGKSGLNLSSSTNCLTITGGVSYSMDYGDYANGPAPLTVITNAGTKTYDDDDGNVDLDSIISAWLNFEGAASSSFGTALAVIKLEVDESASTSPDIELVDAYVSVGDSTVLTAGLAGSIFNDDDDEPLNYLGLFQSGEVDTGVADSRGSVGNFGIPTGGHVIQVVSELGNGVAIGGALEDLNDDGTAVGVISYAGDGVTAHASFKMSDVLSDWASEWAFHAGITLTQDMYTFVGAVAGDDSGYYNALGSVSVGMDMFTLALSGETSGGGAFVTQVGVGGSVSAAVSDTITVNVGARWFDDGATDVTTEVAAQLIAAVTETITITGEVGMLSQDTGDTLSYFGGELAWAPGGGFEASVGAEANSEGAYKVSFDASKDFE